MNTLLNTSAVHAVVMRHLYNWKRDFDRVVDSFWWPLLDLITWGLTSMYLQHQNTDGPSLVIFFLGGAILWIFVQNAQRDMTMPILDEAWNRNLVNIFTTPLRLRELIAGAVCLGFIKLSLTMVVLAATAYGLYRFNIFSFGWFLLPSVINLVLVGWWVGLIINGLILRYGFRVQALAWAFLFVIYPFSAVFYPVSSLPGWAQAIAVVLPTSYIFESMRAVVYTGSFDVMSALISFMLNIIYIVCALAFLDFMFKKALESGRLVKLN